MTKSCIPALLVLAAIGCRSEPPPPIQLAVGSSDSERLEFTPRSAFAEYVELPGVKTELRITLASYEASCERFIPPAPGQASVTVVVVTPPGPGPSPGSFGWHGQSTPPYASPSARIGATSHLFPPGGSLELERVELDLHGQVHGRLAFEFAGDAEREATSVRGAFRARVCRSNRAAP